MNCRHLNTCIKTADWPIAVHVLITHRANRDKGKMFPCTLPCRTISQLKWLLALLTCTCTLFHGRLCRCVVLRTIFILVSQSPAARSQQDLQQMVTCYNSNGCASQGSFQVTLKECCLDHDPNAHPRTYRDDPAAEICISCLGEENCDCVSKVNCNIL